MMVEIGDPGSADIPGCISLKSTCTVSLLLQFGHLVLRVLESILSFVLLTSLNLVSVACTQKSSE